MKLLFDRIKPIAIVLAIAIASLGCSQVESTALNPWTAMELPTEATLLDLGFTGDPERGWLVGTRASLWETTDGGNTWQPRSLDLESDKFNLTSVSFFEDEGWIVGEPSLLLHTDDGGSTWSEIALSEKLPGTPYSIIAIGSGTAEMTTNVGAIYRTENGGYNWIALVREAVGVARNIARSEDGKYVAVSARGNFYSTWEPGNESWEPHERNSSRRVQNMGFGKDGRLWMLARGGQIQFSLPGQTDEWAEAQYPELSTSWGLLDIAYRTPEEIWVAGGSGNLLCSFDGGQTWRKDRDVETVPANFYRILFPSPDTGFILGNRGILLKYEPPAETV